MKRKSKKRKKQPVKVATAKVTKKKTLKKPLLDYKNTPMKLFHDSMRSLFEVQSYSGQEDDMTDYIFRYLEANHPDVKFRQDEKGNLYITKGEANTYPCIVSHTDTVHFKIPKTRYKVAREGNIFYALDTKDCTRTGIGGDDKCGIWVCLEALDLFENIKVAFFVEEETGCVGSSNADMTWFEDVAFVLQTDRRGYKDVVNSISGVSLFGKEFSKAIAPVLENWGRAETPGGLTDVKMLVSNGLDVCVLNSSSGYYAPHTNDEIVKIDELIMTLYLFRDIITATYKDGHRWTYKRKEPVYKTTSRSYGYYGRDVDGGLGYNQASKYEWYKTKSGVWQSRLIKEDLKEEPASTIEENPKCQYCNMELSEYSKGWCSTCGGWQMDDDYGYNY